MFPTFQEFADLKTRSDKDSIQMPIPIGNRKLVEMFRVASKFKAWRLF
jgi:hypothetical protein